MCTDSNLIGETFCKAVEKSAAATDAKRKCTVLALCTDEEATHEKLFFSVLATNIDVFHRYYTSWGNQHRLMGSDKQQNLRVELYGEAGAEHISSELSALGMVYAYLQSASFLRTIDKAVRAKIFNRADEITKVRIP